MGVEPVGPKIGQQPNKGSGFRLIPPLDRKDRPSFAGNDLEGKPISSADLRGSVVVVNFWASWCNPCRNEEAALQRVWARYQDRVYKSVGVRFVGVNIRDSVTNARSFRDYYKVTYPSIFNSDASIAAAFKLVVPPSTFVLDATGRVAVRIIGAISGEKQLSDAIDRVMSA